MVKYDYINYTKLNNFIDQLPESHHDQFRAVIHTGQLVAKTAF